MWKLINNTYTSLSNEKLLVDTSGSSFTITLPSEPEIGEYVFITDSSDFSVNSVTILSDVITFSSGLNELELTLKGSSYEFIYNGDVWNVYSTSFPTIRISDLNEIPLNSISSDDILLYLNNSSGVFESFKITYDDLKSSIIDGTYSSVESIVSDLNEYSNNNTLPFLNAKHLNGNPASFFLNYTNLTNKPLIPSLVSQLSNDSGYITNLLSFTSDDLPEGDNNRYLTDESFKSLFDSSFAEAYRLFSGDFSENTIKDSLDNITANPATVQQSTNILTNIPSSLIEFLQPGQQIRIYGGSDVPNLITTIPAAPVIFKNGFVGASGSTISYRICFFNFEDGRISQRSADSNSLTDIDFNSFNQINNVNVTFSRPSSNFGVLVYRRIGAGDYTLVDVLGQKQLGSITSNISYTDYGTFNYTSWSKKNVNTGAYDSFTGLIHFPLVSPGLPKRGWVDAEVSEVNFATNSITLTNEYYFESALTIVQNDTQKIQAAINERVNAGVNSITLNDRQYIISQLRIPTQFSIYGKGKDTIIKKLPWSTEIDNKIISISSTSAANVNISNFNINGAMQNQWLKNDQSDLAANYTIDLRDQNVSVTIDRLSISNIIGGGIIGRQPSKLLVNLSRCEDSGMSDFYEYSPLVADDGSDLVITNNVFKNFTSGIDLSVSDNGVFSSNVVQNCGTGVLTFGSTFLISSPNILRGPAGEYIPGPDILNSEFDSINITLTPSTTFTSDVYKYQENGINFDISANRSSLEFRVDKLRKVNNVEELYGEVLIGGSKPLQRVIDVALDPTEGEFKFSINSSNVNSLLTTFSYSTLKASETNHIGLVYNALLTEFVPSGNILGTPTISGNEYTVTIRNFSNISLGAKVKLLNHGGTPNLDNIEGTIINIDNTLITSNPPELKVTIDYGQPISSAATGGLITVKNTFILAKGRIL
jgi:hypothetical protein